MLSSFTGITIAFLSTTATAQQTYVVVPTIPTVQPTLTEETAPNQLAAKGEDLAALTSAISNQVNQYRKSKGLPPLKADPVISQQALSHSQAMAAKKIAFSHSGFEQRAKAIAQSIAYARVAENVAYNTGYQDPVRQAVQGWIKSSTHRKNLEGNFNLMGIGVAKNSAGEYYFTQIFVQRR